MTSITGTAANQMRFPGRWFQLEAGLHYNWWRYYDPTLGRYTRPDPLGLSQGPQPPAGDATVSVPNGTPSTSVWTTGLSSSAVGQQTGILAGLTALGQDGRQNPAGLGTDFAASYNPARTSPRDGTSLYGYVRQSPEMRTDLKGLFPNGPMSPIRPNIAQKCGIVIPICIYNDDQNSRSFDFRTCNYVCGLGLTYSKTFSYDTSCPRVIPYEGPTYGD